jgi:hypothetical protein
MARFAIWGRYSATVPKPVLTRDWVRFQTLELTALVAIGAAFLVVEELGILRDPIVQVRIVTDSTVHAPGHRTDGSQHEVDSGAGLGSGRESSVVAGETRAGMRQWRLPLVRELRTAIQRPRATGGTLLPDCFHFAGG